MKFLLPLLRNNILQLSHANQLRYADTKNRTKTITLYMLIAAILMGLLAYLIYSLKIIYSIAWSLEEVVLAPGAHSQFGSGKNTQFEPEQRANPFENVFSKTAVFPPPAIAETDL